MLKDHLRVMLHAFFFSEVLYFLKNMLHKLVVHFVEVIGPSSQELLRNRWNLL